MAKQTEIQKFKRALTKRCFKTSKTSNYSYFMLIPSTFRKPNGDLILTGNISAMIFGGSNTPKGELGCVSFEWQGKVKPYRCRKAYSEPVMKHVIVAENAKHAIAEYDKWHEETKTARKAWKEII